MRHHSRYGQHAEDMLATMTDIEVADAQGAAKSRASRDVGLLALLLIFAAAVPIAVASHYGALKIPRSDDWSYLRTLFVWHRSGKWDFNHWVSMTLVGQIFIAGPIVKIFGTSILAVRMLVVALGCAGLIAVWRMAPTLGLRSTSGWFVAMNVAIYPLWGPLAPTFMTDVPAFAIQMIAIALAARNLQRRATIRGLIVSMGAAGLAISIRQYSIGVAIPILLAYFVVAHRDKNRPLIRATWAVAIASLVGTALLLRWWSHVPNGRALSIQAPKGSSLQLAFERAGGFLRLAGLSAAPCIIWLGPRRLLKRAGAASAELSKLIAGGAATLLGVSYYLNPTVPFVGNYIDRRGVLADDILFGARPDVMPGWAFNAITVVASGFAVILVLALVPAVAAKSWSWATRAETISKRPAMLLITSTIIAFFVMYETATVFRLPIFDRYALPALPLISLLLLAIEPAQSEPTPFRTQVRTAATAVACGVLFALSAAIAAESASYDGTRWAVAEAAVRAGYPIEDVYGSYEWAGFIFGRAPQQNENIAIRQKLRAEYYRGFCVKVVIGDQHAAAKDIVASALSHAPTRSPALIYALRQQIPCAKPPHPKG